MKQKILFISVALLLLLTFGAIALYATSGDKGQTIRLTQGNPNVANNTVQMSIKSVPPSGRPVPAAGVSTAENLVRPQTYPETNRIQQVNGTQPGLAFSESENSIPSPSASTNPLRSRTDSELFRLPSPPGYSDTPPLDDLPAPTQFPAFSLPSGLEQGAGSPAPMMSAPSDMAVSPVLSGQEMDYDPEMQIQMSPENSLAGNHPMPPPVGGVEPLPSGNIQIPQNQDMPDMKREDVARLPNHSYQDSVNNTTQRFEQSGIVNNVTMGRMGTALPGPRNIDGTQSPALILEKIMPQEISINEPMTVKILVRNNGGATANHVTLLDRVPQGARLESTNPQALVTEQGELVWNLDSLAPNTEKTCEMVLVPIDEGELGSVATVTFSVDAGARTVVTKPALTMEVKTEESYMLGESVVFEIALSNPGTGVAENIILEEYVPEGLFHPKGQKLSSPIGSLKPGEVKYLKMSMQAKAPGDMVNRLVALADGGLNVEVLTPIRLLAPRLDLEIDGPKMRYLERKAIYQLHVGNSGSATAKDIKLMAKLPEGVDFISTDSNGVYEPGKHVVHWALEEIPAGQSGNIELVIIPRKLGNCQIVFSGKGAADLRAETHHDMAVQGIAALCFELTDLADPVEIGQNAMYEIRIANQGTKSSQNVKVSVQLSAGMELVDVKAPVSHSNMNGNIEFVSLTELAPKEEKIYSIKAKCLQMGDHRVKVQVISDDLKQPVTKEESTKVYGDE